MSSTIKRILSNVYKTAILVVCVALAVMNLFFAWSERTRSKGSAAVFVVVAVFFIYVVAVLLFQAFESREYERVVTRLGFVPLEWKDMPFRELLPAISQNRKRAFLSRIVQGDVCGTHVFLFNHASDVAWWSKKKTTVVIEQLRESDAGIRRTLAEQGDAALICNGRWCMIQARQEIKPIRLQQWLEMVVTMLRDDR